MKFILSLSLPSLSSVYFQIGFWFSYYCQKINNLTPPTEVMVPLGQESERAHQGWFFSAIQCLETQLERIVCRLIHSREWRSIGVVGWKHGWSCQPAHTDMHPVPAAARAPSEHGGWVSWACIPRELMNLVCLLCSSIRSHPLSFVPFPRLKGEET